MTCNCAVLESENELIPNSHPSPHDSYRRPILLTGSHRSGTTWAGKVIGSAHEVGYIMEPFNDVNRRPGIFAPQFGHFFPYLDAQEKKAWAPAFENTLHFRYDLWKALTGARTAREFGRVLRDAITSSRYRQQGVRPFIKDPNALFLAEWLYETFDMQVVVMIRHPAAFISSLIKLNWAFPFADYLKQPHLMRDYLSSFEDEIRHYAATEQPLIDQAILVWKTLHHVIAQYQEKHQDWLFVKHEDLSEDPSAQFESMFEWLNLDFDADMKRLVEEYSNAGNPTDMTSSAIAVSSSKSIRRDSRSNIFNWKKRLSTDEINYIRERVEPLSSCFYVETDW